MLALLAVLTMPVAQPGPTPAAAPAAPPSVEAAPGQIKTVKVSGKDIGWKAAFDADKCFVARLYSDEPDTIVLLVQPAGEGEFPLVFWFKGDPKGEASVTFVRSGKPAPNPPVPPTPNPPAPNPPTPAPPKPNPLRDRLRAAFDASPGETTAKDDQRKDLTEIYRQAVPLSADPSIATVGQLRAKLRLAGEKLAGNLYPVRVAIADEIVMSVAADAPLDGPTRTALGKLFEQIADALNW